MTKHGGRIEVDFSGTSRQARTCINATALDAKTSVGIAMKYLFDPEGVFTSALLRSVDIVLPEGTIVSALPPDGAVFLYYEQNQAMMAALLRAFAQALGPGALAGDHGGTEIHMAFGAHPDGTPWVSVAQCGGEIGPFGANAHGDADSQMLSYLANGIAVAAEAVEAEVPVVVLRHEIVADSGGAGYNRGGASVVRDTLWLQPAAHSLMTLRAKEAAGFGVNGGGDGKTGGVWVYEPGDDGAAPSPRSGLTRTPMRRPSQASSIRRRTRPISTVATSTRTDSRCIRRRPARRFATSTTAAAAGATRSRGSRSGSSSMSATATSRSKARRATTGSSSSAIRSAIRKGFRSTTARPRDSGLAPDERARGLGRARHRRRGWRRP